MNNAGISYSTQILEAYRKHLTNEKCMAARSVRDYMSIAMELSGLIDIMNGVTYKQINDVIADMKERLQWSQGTVYKYSICVRHLFAWLHREGYRTGNNPYEFSEWRKPRPISPKYLTTEQFQKLVDDPVSLSQQELTLLWLLWDSGARIGEAAQLTQKNIDLVHKIVCIPYEISKGHYSHRQVPISDEGEDLLLKQFAYLNRIGQKEAIFIASDGAPMTKSGLHKVIASIGMRKSPLREPMRLSAHMFRHSCGIRWLSQGIDQVIVCRWLGHNSMTQTLHYINVDAVSSRRIYESHCVQK